jgi:hypothetical protein
MLRIFSDNKDLSFNNYLKNKNGKVIINNLKSKGSDNYNKITKIVDNKIVSYLSYKDFLNILETYYSLSNLKYDIKSPIKITELQGSFLIYNNIIKHTQTCLDCNNDLKNNIHRCNEAKNILYPYGNIIKQEIYRDKKSVDLNKWCNKCINYNLFNTDINFDESNKGTNSDNNNVDLQSNDSILNFNNTLKPLYNIFIAELTNERTLLENKKDNIYEVEYEVDNLCRIYNFNNIYLTYEEFIYIFYNSNEGSFIISDDLNIKLLIQNQTYTNINNEECNFNLTEAIKRIYLEENNFFSMDANKLIEIEKEVINYKSLFDFNYKINSLDLSNIFSTISFKKNVFPSVSETIKIKIKIKVYYKSKISNSVCIMYFNYLVDIPGFKYEFIK